MTRLNQNFRFHLQWLLLLIPLTIGACQTFAQMPQSSYESIKRDLNLESLPVETMREAIYTKAFAQRFNLPEPKAGGELKGGLQAVEISVEEQRALYSCYLKVYLDNKLPIEYPEEGVAGNVLALALGNHFFLRPGPSQDWNEKYIQLNKDDKIHFNTLTMNYRRISFLSNAGYVPQKSGFQHSNTLFEFHRSIMPGFAYLKIGLLSCGAMLSAAQVPDPQLWIKRKGGRDYTKQLQVEPEDFIRLDIPRSFFERQTLWVKSVEELNAKINREFDRRRAQPNQPR